MQTYDLVAPQHLDSIHQQFGGQWNISLEAIRQRLSELAQGRSATAREYAQLREAKGLMKMVKFAGADAPVRRDEIAWALQYISAHSSRCEQLAQDTASALGIDLSQPHAMPMDMARRIENELVLMARVHAA